MPGQVTGNIGDQDVRLENAATESTLQMLVATMEKLAKAQGIKGKDYTKELNYLKQKQVLDSKNLKASDKQNKSLDKVNKNLDNFSHSLGKTIGALGQMSSIIAGKFTKIFSDSTPTIEGALNQIPLVGGVLGALGGIVDQNIKTFRTLAASGIDLGDSIYAAQTAAARAGIPLETFSRVVSENSQALARFGGTAGDGAQKFANIVGKLDKKELARLGMSMDEIAENTASYIEIQSRTGRLAQMSQAELTQGANKYNLELDRLSRATGINRKALDEANQAVARDARMRTALSKLEPEERAKVIARIKQLEEAGATEAADGLKDLIATGGVAVTENARNLVLANKDFADSASAIAKGQKGASTQLDGAIRSTANASASMSDGAAQNATTLRTMGVTTAGYITKTFQGLENVGEDYEKATKEQNKAKESEAKKIAEADQQLTQMINTLKTALLPLLEAFTKILVNILPPITKLVEFFAGLPGTVQTAMLGVAAAIYVAFKTGLISKMSGLDGVGGGAGGAAGGKGGAGKGGKFGKLAGGVKGLGLGAIGSVGGSMLADSLGRDTTSGGLAAAGGTAAGFAGTGAMIGSVVPGIGTAIGGAIGGVVGGAYGLYENRNAIFGSPRSPGGGRPPNGANVPSAAVETASTTSATPAAPIPTNTTDPMTALSSMNAKLDQLNSTMLSLLNIQIKAARDMSRTAQNTVYASGVV